VPQSSITLFDSSRFIPANLYDKIHHEFPDVVFVDHIGADGRVKAEFKPHAIPFSVPSRNATGLDTTVVEAAYLIDAAVLRAHVISGATLCGKNLFGATSIHTDWQNTLLHFPLPLPILYRFRQYESSLPAVNAYTGFSCTYPSTRQSFTCSSEILSRIIFKAAYLAGLFGIIRTDPM
jgi:hypothetical protein